jgi:ABC-type glycerol-3-phosphate transport system permease component
MTAQKLFSLSTVGFYALVVVIVVFSVFPFYYAIITSFATGTELFKVNYWPKSFDWGNYESVLGGATSSARSGTRSSSRQRPWPSRCSWLSPPLTRWRGCGSGGGASSS